MMWRAIIFCLGVVIGYALLTGSARNAPSCLSKREARAIWPRSHLYWHSADHCWDNRRGGRRYHFRGRQYRDPVFTLHAEQPAPAPPAQLYPSLEAMLRAIEPRLIPPEPTFSMRFAGQFADMPPQIAGPPDECCWPELNPDGSLK